MTDINETASRLRTAVGLLVRRARAVSALAGKEAPSHSELGVLKWLDKNGTMTPKALSDAEGVRPQTTGQTLDSLDGRRWITRTPHPKDRRQVLIGLSPSGRKALARGRAIRQAWLVGELGKLTAKERQILLAATDLLRRISQG